jgi:integrase
MRKPCSHNIILPRGLECNRGYLFVRIFPDKKSLLKGCGQHNKANQKTAELLLNDYRQKIALNSFELPKQLKRLTFSEAWGVFFKHHYEEYRHPSRNTPRSEGSKASAIGAYSTLAKLLGNPFFDAITAEDIRVKVKEGISHPATMNRYKGVLSSMFSILKRLSEDGRIEPVKLPKENPCNFVPDLEEKSRDRVASTEELKKLKEACFSLNDPGLWNIILTELDTTLRLGDLKRLDGIETKNGYITIKQGKTGKDITLPDMPKTARGSIFTNRRKRFEKAIEKSGLMNLQFRDLRRTGADMLKKLGYSKELIKDTLGHSSSDTTEKYLNWKDPAAIRPLIEARREHLKQSGLI